jgi:ribose transport system ATP-binding protein
MTAPTTPSPDAIRLSSSLQATGLSTGLGTIGPTPPPDAPDLSPTPAPDARGPRPTPAHDARGPSPTPALQAIGLSKTFGGQRALDNVDLVIAPGEVHGLLGQNGSGKSTLIKIVAGFHAPDPGGRLLIGGNEIALPLPPGRSRALGISFVHQHLGLIPSLTVLENLLLGRLAASRSLNLSWRRLAAEARTLFARYELALDPMQPVSRLSAVERALLAIVRAVAEIRGPGHHGAGVLVLDEPTPFLPKRDVDRLFTLIRGIVADGASVLFVSHDIDEVREITDRVTVLRDGRVAGSLLTRNASRDDVIEMIVGRRLAAFAPTAPREAAPARITVRGLSGQGVNDLSLNLARGEIVGITGLLGSGYEQIPYLLYGARDAVVGEITLDSVPHRLETTTPARSVRRGVVLIPGDRATHAAIGVLPITDNITMPILGNVTLPIRNNVTMPTRGDVPTPILGGSFLPWALARRRMTRHAAQLGAKFGVTPNRPSLLLSALSGGNAQKVVLAKWLQTSPRLILLDEPTQGVDVGARLQVFAALREAAASGSCILCASSDYEQLAMLCDRVLIFANGRVVAELSGAALSKQEIAERCLLAPTQTQAA